MPPPQIWSPWRFEGGLPVLLHILVTLAQVSPVSPPCLRSSRAAGSPPLRTFSCTGTRSPAPARRTPRTRTRRPRPSSARTALARVSRSFASVLGLAKAMGRPKTASRLVLQLFKGNGWDGMGWSSPKNKRGEGNPRLSSPGPRQRAARQQPCFCSRRQASSSSAGGLRATAVTNTRQASPTMMTTGYRKLTSSEAACPPGTRPACPWGA